MIDTSRLPAPENAPEPGACVRVDRPEPGLAVVVLDPPHRKLTVLDAPLLRDLSAAVDDVERDATVRGVVFAGRDPGEFAAGADIQAIEGLTDPTLVEELVRVVHQLFTQIARLRPTTVAAVGGPVPGGAYELALSCDRIVASDAKNTRIGLPETQLGILPGWGGSHRLPDRIGVPAALTAILTGRLYAARQARKLGMVDRLTKPEYLLRVASDVALGRERCPRFRRGLRRWLVDRNPFARAVIVSQARKQAERKARGNYPAIPAVIDLVARAPGVGSERMAEREARAVASLATGPVCKSLISIFKGMEDAKKLGRGVAGAAPRDVTRVGVLGAGVMGGAIASLIAEKGVDARLMDVRADALDVAQLEHRAALDKKRRRRRLQRHEADAAIDRLEVTTEIRGFERCDVVVEAVAERLDVKQQVLDAVAAQVGERAVLATNTSSLSVGAIAERLPHPQRVCGMHFFNPVRAMPLCEVVRGERTEDGVVATVAALALRLGKTPVVVRDVPGFLVNRILGPYLDEALRLFQGGADVTRVDRLMLDFGMPMGPFALLDEVGWDIAQHAARSLHEAYGARMTPSDGLDAIAGPERLGKKTGRGFYVHGGRNNRRAARPVPASDLAQMQQESWARALDDRQIVDRLVLSMVNEAARCLEERVVDSARALDLATVLGTGFAPFRGGVLRYADTLGAGEVCRRLDGIARSSDVADRPGGAEKFTPAALLTAHATDGGAFHGTGQTVRSDEVAETVASS